MRDEARRTAAFIPHPSSLIPKFLVPAVRQHSLDAFLIALGHHHVNVEISLSLVRFLGQDVTRVRMTAFDLARRGRAKSLRRALVCFQFWHNSPK